MACESNVSQNATLFYATWDQELIWLYGRDTEVQWKVGFGWYLILSFEYKVVPVVSFTFVFCVKPFFFAFVGLFNSSHNYIFFPYKKIKMSSVLVRLWLCN
jgi:hypothetical protein